MATDYNQTLKPIVCANCGLVFAINADYESRRRGDSKIFYCPNGHTQHYPAKKTENLEAQIAELQKQKSQLTEQVKQLQKENSELKSAKIKLLSDVDQLQAQLASHEQR